MPALLSTVPFAHYSDCLKSALDSAGRVHGKGFHYGFNIILVPLIGRKHKRHLCHHLGPHSSHSSLARHLFLGPLPFYACPARSF